MNENTPHDSASASSENPKAVPGHRTPNPKTERLPADHDDPGIGATAQPLEPPSLPPHESLWPERWRTIRFVSFGVGLVLLVFGIPIALLVWALATCKSGLSTLSQ